MPRARRGDVLDPPVPPLPPPPATRPRLTSIQRSERREKVGRAYETKSKVMDVVGKALTAAADFASLDKGSSNAPNAATRTWQHAVFGYASSVPELGAAKLYVGNALARCSLQVGKRSSDGSVEQGFDGDEPVEGLDATLADEAAEIIASIRSPRGGQSELLRNHGEKTFLVGEYYLVPLDTPAGMVFEVLSTQELVKEGTGWARYDGPGYQSEKLPEGTEPIRVWRPDAQFGKQATSSVRSCMEVLEELVVLTRLVRASAISRMALAGVFVIPDEIDSPTDEGFGPDGDQSETKNPLLVDIINTGAKAIDDPASAAAFMPYMFQAPAELLQHIRHIPFQATTQEHVIQRDEALQRLAQGLDLPVEVVRGHQATTFANAAQINADIFTIHIAPTLQLLCDALTETVLWPQMAKNRGIDAEHLKDTPYPEEILNVAVTYDARELISRPDRVKEMIELWNRDLSFFALSRAEIREALGLDGDGGPDDDELAQRVNTYRLGRVRENIPAPASDAAVPVAEAAAGNATDTAKPRGTVADPATELQSSAAMDQAESTIQALADYAIERAVERVGAKVREKMRGRSFTEFDRSLIEGMPNHAVTSILGPDLVTKALGSETPSAVIASDINALERTMTQMGVGTDPVAAAKSISQLTMTRALDRMFTPIPVGSTP